MDRRIIIARNQKKVYLWLFCLLRYLVKELWTKEKVYIYDIWEFRVVIYLLKILIFVILDNNMFPFKLKELASSANLISRLIMHTNNYLSLFQEWSFFVDLNRKPFHFPSYRTESFGIPNTNIKPR